MQKAIRRKQDAFLAGAGERQAEGVTVTRNDIINRLDDLSQNADCDSTRVSALRELVDIFGLSSKYSDHDPFAGWTIEELEEFHRTGRWPDRYATAPAASDNEG